MIEADEKKEVVNFLRILKKLNKKELSVLIANLDNDGINKICQIFFNVVYKNVKPKNKLKTSALKKLMLKKA